MVNFWGLFLILALPVWASALDNPWECFLVHPPAPWPTQLDLSDTPSFAPCDMTWSPEVWTPPDMTLLCLDDWEETLIPADTPIEITQEWRQRQYQMALEHFRQSRYVASHARLEELLKDTPWRNPLRISILWGICLLRLSGCVYAESSAKEMALGLIEIIQDPHFPRERKEEAVYFLALMSIRGSDLSQTDIVRGEILLTKLLASTSPLRDYARYQLGLLYQSQGKHSLALEMFQDISHSDTAPQELKTLAQDVLKKIL